MNSELQDETSIEGASVALREATLRAADIRAGVAALRGRIAIRETMNWPEDPQFFLPGTGKTGLFYLAPNLFAGDDTEALLDVWEILEALTSSVDHTCRSVLHIPLSSDSDALPLLEERLRDLEKAESEAIVMMQSALRSAVVQEVQRVAPGAARVVAARALGNPWLEVARILDRDGGVLFHWNDDVEPIAVDSRNDVMPVGDAMELHEESPLTGAEVVAAVMFDIEQGIPPLAVGRAVDRREDLLRQRAERLGLASLSTYAVTPELLSRALGEAGFIWDPSKTWEGGDVDGHYLYAWVAPQAEYRSDVDQRLQGSPVLYLGISTSATPHRRLQDETNWTKRSNPTMGLSIAVSRHASRAVFGEVELLPALRKRLESDEPERTHLLREFALEKVSWAQHPTTIAGKLVDFWKGIDPASPVKAAELLAIRAAIHLGHIGAPVNSASAGAWESDTPTDWMAYAVRGQLEGWTKVGNEDLSTRL